MSQKTRFMEERSESLLFLDSAGTVRMIRKSPYTLLKYRYFNGEKVRYTAKEASHEARMEEEDAGDRFLCELDGQSILIRDQCSVADAIMKHQATGDLGPYIRLWKWHWILDRLSLVQEPSHNGIDLTREGRLLLPQAVTGEVLEWKEYGDGSRVARVLFTLPNRAHQLYGVFRNHTMGVALIGRDETGQTWLHFVPPEYKDRTIEECETWLVGGDEGDTILTNAT